MEKSMVSQTKVKFWRAQFLKGFNLKVKEWWNIGRDTSTRANGGIGIVSEREYWHSETETFLPEISMICMEKV